MVAEGLDLQKVAKGKSNLLGKRQVCNLSNKGAKREELPTKNTEFGSHML